MKYLRVKKWDEHQHYTDRDPPWIKVYNRLLDDYEFLALSEAAQSQLMKLWLLASRTDNRIPFDMTFIAAKIGAKSAVDVEGMIVAGWLELSDGLDAVARPSKVRKVASRKKKDREHKRSVLIAERQQSAPTSASNLSLETEERRDRGREEKNNALRTAAAASEPKNWVARFTQFWRDRVGDTTYARVGKALTGSVSQHGESVVWPAFVEYVEHPSNGKAKKLEWFAQDVVRWIAEASEPVERDGVLTEKGRRFMGVA
jgi:hypothetical protein